LNDPNKSLEQNHRLKGNALQPLGKILEMKEKENQTKTKNQKIKENKN